MNLTKRTDVKFVNRKKLKTQIRSNKLISVEPINFEAEIFEVRKRKSSVLDKIPVQCAAMILSSAKLHFLQFVSDLADNLDPSSFKILYMGNKKDYIPCFKYASVDVFNMIQSILYILRLIFFNMTL